MMKYKKCLRFCGMSLMVLFNVNVYAFDVIENQWDMQFVKIPAGSFKMGLDDLPSALMAVPEPKDNELRDELPVHTVNISTDFLLLEQK